MPVVDSASPTRIQPSLLNPEFRLYATRAAKLCKCLLLVGFRYATALTAAVF